MMKTARGVFAALMLCSAALPTTTHGGAAAEAFFACGGNRIVLFRDSGNGFSPEWSWTSDDSAFARIDECKPAENGRILLVTASSGGVAVVERASGAMRFRTDAFMAHSIASLPKDRLAVAVSLHATGNRLVVYDPPNREPIITIPFHSAHGVVFDEARRRLYASGGAKLVEYRLEGWDGPEPKLVQVAEFVLPGLADGHDLSRLDTDRLLLTTADGVWVFDQTVGRFDPFDPLRNLQDAKAVDVESTTGRIVYQKASEKWWSHEAGLARPDGVVATPDMRLYKVRWLDRIR